uniref:Serum response factor-binding protein 1-like n=1 Tax=Ciona intestinalis TaxID=7719 RepID=F6TDV1_CIOIN|nr:serum response factor-binding protein 1-like [Ciona intestinalis]|eukprot:XP_002130181.1 serum response factor-binding protein 1-like [Ciona intestinalis]
MDFNNEMILMRKDLKRAKVHVISKLVRRNKSLKSKNAPEHLKQKNISRANRLLQEIEIIKDMKPDVIFKHLVTNDRSGNLDEMALRVLSRIGTISFIEPKISQLKLLLHDFEANRKKEEVSLNAESAVLEKSSELPWRQTNVVKQPETNQNILPHPEKCKTVLSLSEKVFENLGEKFLDENEIVDDLSQDPFFKGEDTLVSGSCATTLSEDISKSLLKVKKDRKRNRPGQNARDKLYGKTNSSKKGKPKKVKTKESVSLHPSWQASQVKKKENIIQKFQGTKIRFSDSE